MNNEDFLNHSINESVLTSFGFKLSEPPDKKFEGLYKWFVKESWYVVWNNMIGGYYFQRQIKIETINDLSTIYKNSVGKNLKAA